MNILRKVFSGSDETKKDVQRAIKIAKENKKTEKVEEKIDVEEQNFSSCEKDSLEESKRNSDTIVYNNEVENNAVDSIVSTENNNYLSDDYQEKKVVLKKKYIIKKKNVEIGEKIGSGQYGEVRKGLLKLPLGRKIEVAIKIIVLGKLNPNECKKEVLMMTQASHKHVAKIYGVYFDEGKAFIVMELCDESLYHKLKYCEDIPLKKKLDYLIQIASGMNYLHQNKIVHRDLKTQNILINSKQGDRLKITDFGTAKHFSSITGTLCGTVEYLAPEQFNLDLFQDANLIDIYSFGIIIWEVLMQTLPFKKTKRKFRNNMMGYLQEIMVKRMRPNTKHLKGTPFLLIALMKKCWSQNPKNRPQSFKEILKILKNVKVN